MVLVSLIAQGASLGWTARLLKLALPDTAPAVKRFEIDLPGQQQLELVAYPVEEGCSYLTASYTPVWLKPVFVVRGDEVVSTEQAGPLTPGDYGYFLVPPKNITRLDALFDTSATSLNTADFQGFAFDGTVALGLLAEEYKFDLTDRFRELTIAQAFAERFDDVLRVGDRLELDTLDLVAVALDGDTVSRAILELPEEPDWPDRVRLHLARITAALRVRRPTA